MFNNRHIPTNSTPNTRDGINAIAYTYEINGKLCAIAYIGKSNKPAWHYNFKNEEQRQARINQLFEGAAQRQESTKARRQERTAYTHTLKAGTILYASWGYDQTNIDFYEVISTTEKTATFREIAHDRTRYTTPMDDQGTCRPMRGSFIKDAKTYTRTVRPGNSIHFAEYEGGMMRYLSVIDRDSYHWSDGH